jgi:lysophospholipid acyltransferase (LPLAT)-like uncharacterized protein
VSQTYPWKQRLALATVPHLAYMTICLLGVTLRFEDIVEPGASIAYHTPPPLIYGIWHRCMLACAWRFRQGGIRILVSRSFDGELITRTVKPLDIIAVRGSSSRDGASGLRNLQRAYLDGNYCVITADGPRGPAQVAKPGIANLAQLVDSPVGAIYVHPHRAWTLRSWDRFLIPKPFSKVTIAWTKAASNDVASIQDALDRATRLAQSSTQSPS